LIVTTLKPEKCIFEKPEVEFCSVILGYRKIWMDPKKIEVVKAWPIPKSKKELQSFLGFCNFYWQFIEKFSNTAAPLNKLTGKDNFNWKNPQQEAFDKIKKCMMDNVVLLLPDEDKQYRVKVDALDKATGVQLSQEDTNRGWCPVAFISKLLSPAEKNYHTYNKELLAIMVALQEWCQYLLSTKKQFEIWSNHKNLGYFKKPQLLNGQQTHWSLELAYYNYKLVNVEGKHNKHTNLLSRQADHMGQNKTKLEQFLIPEEQFTMNIRTILFEPTRCAGIWAIAMVRNLSVEEQEELLKRRWIFNEDGYWRKDRRIFIPSGTSIEKTIKEHHDTLYTGHPGILGTSKLIKRHGYWWQTMNANIETYVTGCTKCQRTKADRTKKVGLLHPNTVPTEPWEEILIDLITKLPKSRGFTAICIIVNQFTKMAHFIPCSEEPSSIEMAHILENHIFWPHSKPRKIISNCGSNFTLDFMKEFYITHNIIMNASTAYHPQTNRQTKQVNQELEQYLQIFCNFNQNDWCLLLSLAKFQYNNQEHSVTKESPSFLNYGRHPIWNATPPKNTLDKSMITYQERMTEAQGWAFTLLNHAAEHMKSWYNWKRKAGPKYKIGEKVMITSRDLKTTRPTQKLANRNYSPFTIQEIIGQSAYKLNIPTSWVNIHNVFNKSVLKRWIDPKFPSQMEEIAKPPAIIIDGNEEWEVKFIIKSQQSGQWKKLQYIVKWKGYPLEEKKWYNAELIMQNAWQTIKNYHRENPTAEQWTTLEFELWKEKEENLHLDWDPEDFDDW
jgi:hypothetical protein